LNVGAPADRYLAITPNNPSGLSAGPPAADKESMPLAFGATASDVDSAFMPASDASSSAAERVPGSGRGGIRFVTDIIVERGFASRERVEEAILAARSAGITVEQLLVDQRAITVEQRGRAVAERLGLEFLDLSAYPVDMAAVALLPADVAKRNELVPIALEDDRTLMVAMADPANVVAIDDVEIQTGMNVRTAVATREDILAVIAQMTRLDSAVTEMPEEGVQEEAVEVLDLQESAAETPIVKLVNSLLAQAVAQGASDIHFAPGAQEMRVRLRVDGVLSEVARVPSRMVAGVVSRIKIMCELDISERRLPQDGRLGLTVEGTRIDIRAVTLPTIHGESVVMRILDSSNALIAIPRLGLDPYSLDRLTAATRHAHGAVLVTGPTGSGKSTTLYAVLNSLNTPDKNIITIEDPVEYQLEGITQVATNKRSGLTFATGLRSMMRADPDIIMVGEIRDRETAQIGIEAALTGHLVLSTLHTNDAPGSITRLVEMGIEPFLVASAVRCVVAQRLTRVLCTSCKRPVTLEASVLERSSFEAHEDVAAYEAVGCTRCGGGGYRGRIGIYEIMPISDAIAELTLHGAPSDQIGATARAEGMRTLRDDAFEKVRAGVTSIEEAMRVLGG
jgi:type IV pilus assembly protein PilB